MKIIKAIIFLILVSATNAIAQTDSIAANTDTSYWDKGGLININFSQVDLTNWNGGGKSSISIGGLSNFKANYEKGKNAWSNRLDLAYGLLRQGENENPFIKTDDNIILTSRYSRQLKKRIFISGMVDFRTQFDEGLNEENEVISRFLAPGFLLANIGLTYRYKEIFSASFSPLSSKTTIVTDDSLSNAGAYGVEIGETTRFQGGINFSSSFQKDIWENVNLSTNLNMFADYEKLGNIDINWETALIFKINSFLSASYSTQLIYDDDIKSKEIVINEALGEFRYVPGIQFKSVMNIGLNIKIPY
ncbi:DUF3078 domain-containing protein [Marivirga arenosa]|uniref:DUF3078 domain-containing protein n=1 Tax=Marivirga arenosa TaxID=3059076 RepID=A0AA51R650_9BACT|nr:DUF3078 domain-containing protein [Marivirga sp. ABR2-2]WMN06307.1 DUF3078 domain-containing protein [Marivirga sp. ABR2-2]